MHCLGDSYGFLAARLPFVSSAINFLKSSRSRRVCNPPALKSRVAKLLPNVWPVGTLLPSDFGLFDVYGNVLEWCQDICGRLREISPERGRESDCEGERRKSAQGSLICADWPRNEISGRIVDSA